MAERYPLEALLNVRRYREEAAERGVLVARNALQAAQAKLQEEEAALEAWKRWRTAEVERRYRAIIGRRLSIDGMLDFNQGLAALEAEAFERALRVSAAKDECEAKRELVDKAKAAAKDARQNALKIEKHKSIWAEAAKIESERAEEREFEEFKAMPGLAAAD